ncbi:hypothetical protein SESBI_04812 [Sesbania bispinosa]|nr:hypothetical protein SESBI_04812 [Sesbania bispinosa]
MCGLYGHGTSACTSSAASKSHPNENVSDSCNPSVLPETTTKTHDQAICKPDSMDLQQIQDSLHGDKVKNKDPRKSPGTSMSADVQSGDVPQKNEEVIFKSSALPISDGKDSRKKRHRVDDSIKTVQIHSISKPTAKPKIPFTTKDSNSVVQEFVNNGNSSGNSGKNPFGIKAMLNVDIIAANRLRFKEGVDPSEESPSRVQEGVASQCMAGESDVDMQAGTNHSQHNDDIHQPT